MLLQLAVLLATVSGIALSSCSYVEADFIAMKSFKLGTFTFAMSKCQGLAIKMPKPLSLTLDGSIKFKLRNGKDVYAYVFSDPYCTVMSQQSPQRPNPVKIGTTGTSSTVNVDLFGQRIPGGGLEFVIKKIQSSSSQSVCGLSMAAARDCSWGRSDFYLNLSMPTGQCVDAKMGKGPMMGGKVPGGVANNLNKKFSMKMDCCQDGSLRLSNYTGFGCAAASIHSDIIPASYNGQCLNLTQPIKRRRLLGGRSSGSILMDFVYSKLFGPAAEENVGRKLLQAGGHHHGHGGPGGKGGKFGSSSNVPPPPANQLIFELRWECSSMSSVSCQGIKKLTSSELPPKCSSRCQLKSESWWSKMVNWYRHRATSQPGYPIDRRHWRTTVKGSTATSNGASATDNNGSSASKKSDLSGIDIAAIILSVVFFLVLVGAMVYCCIMKKMDRNLNQLSRRSYAPMMGDGGSELEQQNSNAVQV